MTDHITISDFKCNFADEGEFNYSVHISTQNKYIYFSNPKVGCTTLKATLNLMEAKTANQNLIYSGMGQIHSRKYNLLKTPHAIGYGNFLSMIEDKSVIKFCFVREPIERFASAYASKLMLDRNEAKVVKTYLGLPQDQAMCDLVPPDRFAQLVSEDEALRDLNEHWRLQRKQTCFDLVPQMICNKMTHFQRNLKSICENIFDGHEFEIFDARVHFAGNRSQSAKVKSELTPDAMNALKSAYSADFDLFDQAR